MNKQFWSTIGFCCNVVGLISTAVVLGNNPRDYQYWFTAAWFIFFAIYFLNKKDEV